MIRQVARLATVIVSVGVGQAVSAAQLPCCEPSSRPALLVAAEMQMEVAGAYANLRAKPTIHAKLLSKLPHGTKVAVIGKAAHGSWYHVVAAGKEGYIRADLLR